MNVAEADLDKIVKLIPSITAPTVSPLYATAALRGVKWFSIESVIAEDVVRELIPKLIKNGAVGIIEYPLNKVI
jgi:ATP phosphoribosyltransferase